MVLKDFIYVLDPGHGGSDIGAPGVGADYEKVLNLKLSNKIKEKLAAKGCTVKMTRTSDVALDLSERSKKVNSLAGSGNICVSVHFNASDDKTATGTETLIRSTGQLTHERSLATEINTRMATNLGLTNRGVKVSDLAVFGGYSGYVKNNLISCLIEPCFISNSSDYNKINTDAKLDSLATAIVAGLNTFVVKNFGNILPS